MGTSEIVLERVQALLKIDTGNGSLHEHLIRLSRKLADEKPGEALAQLETLSSHLKQATFRGRPAPDVILPTVADPEAEEALLRWCSSVLNLTKPLSDPTAPPKVLGVIQNFMEDSAMLRWAGVGFGQQESYHIALSLRKLASDIPSIESLRLWGKVLGTEGDYYVAEGMLTSIPKPTGDDAGGEVPIPVMPGDPEYDVEPRGEGANSFTYWVSLGAMSPWERLPAARASQIVSARAVKKVLTGSLDAPVLSMPWFPGKECHLLRAQIARISATCTLSPAGYYELDADTGVVKETEGFEFPAADALKEPDGWVHRMPYLMKIGKCSFPDPSSVEEDKITDLPKWEAAKTVLEAQVTDEGDPKDRFAGIGTDLEELKGEADGTPAWSIKTFGDQGMYAEDKTHKVTAVRSLIWPGAVTVAQGSKFANIYVGYAMKCGSLVPTLQPSGLPLDNTSPFFPLVPDPIMTEPDDEREEQDEPNPKEDDNMDDDDKSVDEDES